MSTKQKTTGDGLWWLKVLAWYCPPQLYEGIAGDLLEQYEQDATANVRRARRRLAWNVIGFFRPGIVLRNKFSINLIHFYMILSHYKNAWRSLRRNALFSTVNIVGLSISMTVSMFILLYVQYELSYDTFHRDAARIHRVSTQVWLENEMIHDQADTYGGIAEALRNDDASVQAATTLNRFTSDDCFVRHVDGRGGITSLENFKGYFVDKSFFEVFSFPLEKGDPKQALAAEETAAISASFAGKYFQGDALGKTLEVNDGDTTRSYRITAVFQNVPSASHIAFDLLIRGDDPTDPKFWDWTGKVYLKVFPGTDVNVLKDRLASLAKSKNDLKTHKNDYGQVSTFVIQPLTDIHLHSHRAGEFEVNGSGVLVYALLVLAIAIVVIAWVNYMNLSTAISESRARAIGVRKIIGASRASIAFQVFAEAAVINIISVAIAVFLLLVLFPSFSQFANISGEVLGSARLWIFVLLFVMISILLSGVYPALVIGSFLPVVALKGRGSHHGNVTFRKSLVVFQFAVAVALIVITVAGNQQLSYMRNKELGITITDVLVIKALNFDKETWSNEKISFIVDSAYHRRVEAFKHALQARASVVQAAGVSHIPGQLPNWGTEVKAEQNDPEKAFNLKALGVDYNFLETFQLKLLAGRNFSRDHITDQGNEAKRAILLNETAAKLLGFKKPADAVNQTVKTFWGGVYDVVGVVSSFHQLSPRENLVPVYFILQPRALPYFAVRLEPRHLHDGVKDVRHLWESHFPNYPFDYFFLDDFFNEQYAFEQRFENIATLFSGLTIFIACLGLFGLTAYAMTQRAREISIRKVMGASVSNVVGLFANHFVKLILLGSALAVPLVFWGVHAWLEKYAFRVAIPWWVFLLPVAGMVLLAVVIVCVQTLQVALSNPVNHLRHE